MYTYWLADKLKDRKVTVNCISVTKANVELERYPRLGDFTKWVYNQKSKKGLTPEEITSLRGRK